MRAALSSPSPDVPIFFRWFDVDDPSNSGQIDPNGANGDDNRGTPLATLSAALSQTDASGAAQVELTVSMPPGDNFRIAAACNSTYLGNVRVIGTDLIDGSGKIPATTYFSSIQTSALPAVSQTTTIECQPLRGRGRFVSTCQRILDT